MMQSSSIALKNICEFIVDCEHKTAPTQTTGYPSIRTPNIGKGRLILNGVNRVSEEIYQQWTQRAVPQANDLILAREAPVGNVAVIPKNLKVCLGQRTVLIRPNKSQVDPYYLVYLLLGDEVQSRIQSLSNGSTVHHLNVADIKNLLLPSLPLLSTQRKIAAILSAYDDLIENNTRRIAILEQMAQALYREWFVHFRFPGHEKKCMVESALGMIPEGWEVVSFTDMVDVLSGGTPKTTIGEYWNGDIPFFTPKDASASFYVIETERSITERGLKSCNSKLYPKDTVFITARGTVGKVVLASTNMAMSQSSYALRGKNGLDRFFTFLLTRNCIDQLRQNSHGAVFDTIIVDTFVRLRIIKPSIVLIKAFSTVVEPIFEEILNLLHRNANLRQTRDLLLPKLISGEVDVEGLEVAGGEKEPVAPIDARLMERPARWE